MSRWVLSRRANAMATGWLIYSALAYGWARDHVPLPLLLTAGVVLFTAETHRYMTGGYDGE